MAKSPAQTANSRLYSKYTHVYMYTDHTVDFQQSNVCITTIHVPNIFDDDIVQNYRAPQHLVHYLRDLAADFHSWYNSNKFIDDPDEVRDARLALHDDPVFGAMRMFLQ